MRIRYWVLTIIALAVSTQGIAATAMFTGSIIQVETDLGGVYAGTTVNDEFTAQFDYPDSGGASTINEPDEANYELAGINFLSTDGMSVMGTDVRVNIQNNQPTDAEGAEFINTIVLTDPPTMTGDPIDSWTISGLEAGAFEEDTTPGDGNDEETLFDGVLFEFTLLSVDATLYDNLDYRPSPPAFDDAALRVFVVREADAAGNLIFEAIGIIDEVLTIPDTVFADGFEP